MTVLFNIMDIAQQSMVINDLEVSAGSEDQIQADFELKTDARSVLQSQIRFPVKHV